VAFCGNTVREQEVLEVFGLTSERIVADLTRAILSQTAAVALAIVHQQAEAGKDLTKLLGDLLAFFRNLLIFKIDPQSLREEISDQARASLEELVAVVETPRLLRLIEEISEVEATIKWTSNKKLHFEIALIRAIHTLSEVSLENVVDALENLVGVSSSHLGKEIKSPPAREETSIKESTKGGNASNQIAEASPSARSEAGKIVQEDRAVQTSEILIEPSASVGSPWERVVQEVRTRRPLIVSWIEAATPLSFENGTLKLGFPKNYSLAVESLSRPNHQKLIEEVVGQLLGGSWRLEFELRDDLSAAEIRPVQSQQIDPMEDFKKDPMIQKALEIFKAEIHSGR
jgi:DNA polymerase III subunit gamma/tau